MLFFDTVGNKNFKILHVLHLELLSVRICLKAITSITQEEFTDENGKSWETPT